MMTAKQALEITNKNRIKLAEIEFKSIEQLIGDAVIKGENKISYTGKMYDPNVLQLRELGYYVSYYNNSTGHWGISWM